MAKYVGQHARDRVKARLLKEKGNRQQLHVGECPIIDGGTRRVGDQVVTRPLRRVHEFTLILRDLLLHASTQQALRVGCVARVHQLVDPSKEPSRLLDEQPHDVYEMVVGERRANSV